MTTIEWILTGTLVSFVLLYLVVGAVVAGILIGVSGGRKIPLGLLLTAALLWPLGLRSPGHVPTRDEIGGAGKR